VFSTIDWRTEQAYRIERLEGKIAKERE